MCIIKKTVNRRDFPVLRPRRWSWCSCTPRFPHWNLLGFFWIVLDNPISIHRNPPFHTLHFGIIIKHMKLVNRANQHSSNVAILCPPKRKLFINTSPIFTHHFPPPIMSSYSIRARHQSSSPAYGWNGHHHFGKFQLVEDGGLSRCVQAQHQDSHLLGPLQTRPDLAEEQAHRLAENSDPLEAPAGSWRSCFFEKSLRSTWAKSRRTVRSKNLEWWLSGPRHMWLAAEWCPLGWSKHSEGQGALNLSLQKHLMFIDFHWFSMILYISK